MKCKNKYVKRQQEPLDYGKYLFKNKQAPTYPVLLNFVFILKASSLFQCDFRDPRKMYTQIKSIRASGPGGHRNRFRLNI